MMMVVMVMVMVMMSNLTQQWLHPSDAGGPERGGRQCEATGGQHVPLGDAGDDDHGHWTASGSWSECP